MLGNFHEKSLHLLAFAGLWVWNGNELAYSVDVNVYFYCKMAFSNYPLDKQVNLFIIQ